MKYNANGGQRRSRKVKLAIPNGQSGFTQFVVSLMQAKQKYGKEIAQQALEKYADKYRLEPDELAFLRGLIK